MPCCCSGVLVSPIRYSATNEVFTESLPETVRIALLLRSSLSLFNDKVLHATTEIISASCTIKKVSRENVIDSPMIAGYCKVYLIILFSSAYDR